MEKGEVGWIVYLQLLSIRHNNAIWSGNSDFITKRGILGIRPGDGGGQVESDKAQDFGDVYHFHDLKE